MRKIVAFALAFGVLLLVPAVGNVSAAENDAQYNALCDPMSPHYGGYGNEPSTMCVASFGGKLAEKNLALKALEAKVRELERQNRALKSQAVNLKKEIGELKSVNEALNYHLDSATNGWKAESDKVDGLMRQLKQSNLQKWRVVGLSVAAIFVLLFCFVLIHSSLRNRYHLMRVERDALAGDKETLRYAAENLSAHIAELSHIASEQIAERTRQADKHEAQVSELSEKISVAESALALTRYQGLGFATQPDRCLRVWDTEKLARPAVHVNIECPGHGMHGAAKIELRNLRKHMENLHWKDESPTVAGEAPAAPDAVVDESPSDEPLGGEA